MTTSATRNISSTMHWAAWLSLILAVFGLWLLVEIKTHKTIPSPDETRYPVAQHDFFENSAPSQEPMAKNKPTPETITGVNGVVETIRVQMDGARACTVFIDLDGDQPPETEVLEGEAPRLVNDFPGMMADPDILHTISVHNGLINAIRVGITDQDPLTTRVVVDLIPGADYVVDPVFYQEEQTYALHIKAKEV